MNARVETLLRIPRLLADSSGEAEQLFAIVAQQIAAEMVAFCGLLRVDPERGMLVPVARAVPPAEPLPKELEAFIDNPVPLNGTSQLARVVRERRAIHSGPPSELHVRGRYQDERQIQVVLDLRIQDTLMIPILAHGEVLGVLSLFRRGAGAKPFSQDEVEFANQLSDHAALVLVNTRLVEQARSQARRLQTLAGLTRELSAARTSQAELLELIVQRIGSTIADSCTIRLVGDDGCAFTAIAMATRDPSLRALCEVACDELVSTGYGGAAARVLETKTSVLVPTLALEALVAGAPPKLRAFIEQVEPASMLVVPVLVEQRVIAVLMLTRNATWPAFTAEDRHLVEELAGHCAIKIANMRLLESTRSANRRLSALTDAAAVFASGGRDTRQLVGVLADLLIRQLGGGCAIRLERTSWQDVVEVHHSHDGANAILDRLELQCCAGDEALGSVVLTRGAPYSDEERQFAQDVVGHAGLAIRTSRLLAAVHHESTERAKTQGALSASQEQLRHVQKLDAIGRLAGGVAHDFNNILSVVLTSCAFISEQLREGDPIEEDVEQIRKAGERAAALTRQLLLFSRQEALEPRVLDLYEEVNHIQKMLRRLVGEHISVSLGRPIRALVKADRGHLEQVLMNLAVNARDAMPRGGKLAIEITREEVGASTLPGVEAGSYVVLTVTDTGDGMDPATKERIFEPFFTTKPSGKGTGLGLSTVYGIITQCGGSIHVTSSLGQGSAFKILLPRVDDALESAEPLHEVSRELGEGTILLVEDDSQVRRVAATILSRGGYDVIEARNGQEALAIYDRTPTTIDLVLTDVVMPVMGGRELAENLAKRAPALKLLFMTGYTDDTVLQHHLTSSGSLLHKPLSVATVLRKVREILTMQ